MGLGAGLAAAVGGAIDAFAGAGTAAALAGSLGLADAAGAATGLGLAAEGAGIGAIGGGALDAATGKPILPGVAEGALTGGSIGGLGPAIGGGLGIGTGLGDVIAGAGAGALGGAVIPGAGGALSGAESGGIGGAISGITSGLTSGTTGGTGGGATPTSGTGAGAGAAASAAPASIGGIPSAGSALSQDAGAALGGGAAGGGLPGTPGIGGPSGGGGDVFSLSGPSDAVSAGSSDNVVSISGLGTANPVTTPGSAVPPTPVSNPELGGATGFSPGGATETVSPGSSIGNLYNSIFGNQLDPVSAAAAINPAAPASAIGGTSSGGIGGLLKGYGGPLVAAGGLGLDLLRGNTPVAGESQLNTEAGQLATQGQQLQGYLQSGTLPPGVQQSITSASDSAKAAIRSQYAAMGGGNTSAMQQDLARVDQTAATQGAQIATQLLSQGVSETGLSEQIYSSLMNQATQQNAQLGSAIGSLATSLAGTPTVLKLQSAA